MAAFEVPINGRFSSAHRHSMFVIAFIFSSNTELSVAIKSFVIIGGGFAITGAITYLSYIIFYKIIWAKRHPDHTKPWRNFKLKADDILWIANEEWGKMFVEANEQSVTVIDNPKK